MILEPIYEPVFHDTSHGFRPKRSCHTALKKIAYWSGTKWFIEFDIEGYFDNIDHKVLMGLLEKKIDDEKFLNVIRKMTKAGYVENWKFHGSYSGTPQGGILSPILANIYLHELDCFVAKLITDFERGKKRANNPEYVRDHNIMQGLNKRRERETNIDRRNDLLMQKKQVQRHMLTLPSANQYDEDYPYSDTSRTYAPNSRIYGYIKNRFPLSLATVKPRFYVSKFGQRTEVTL